jgi:hypothetical protein
MAGCTSVCRCDVVAELEVLTTPTVTHKQTRFKGLTLLIMTKAATVGLALLLMVMPNYNVPQFTVPLRQQAQAVRRGRKRPRRENRFDKTMNNNLATAVAA